jgi:hypothetical protein
MKLKQNLGKTEIEKLKKENQQLTQLASQRALELQKANEEIEKLTPKKKKSKKKKAKS